MKWLRKGTVWGNREGAAMVEFAITLPLLTMAVFGIVEMGNAWRREQVLATAAREGVRVGAQYNPSHTSDTVKIAVQQYLRGARFDTTKLKIWTNCCASERYDSVTVTDTLKFPVTSHFSPLPARKVLNVTAVMRREAI